MEGLRARVDALVSESADWLIDIRHELHAHPELSNREERTAALVADHLRELGIDEVRTSIAGHGVVGVLRGGGTGDRVVALRADMDALPVRETSGVPFASTVVDATYPGGPFPVSHACGHDCHVATVLASARVLAGVRDALPGTVMFLFQPAEEGPPLGETGGAQAMLDAGALADPVPSMVFGMHVSALPRSTVGYRVGTQYAASCVIRIEVVGVQAHASTPWLGVDPMPAAAAIITGLAQAYRQVPAYSPISVSIGHVEDVGRFNIIGERVTLYGTIRTLADSDMATVQQQVRTLAEHTALAHGCTATTTYPQPVPAVTTSRAWMEAALPTLQRVLGSERVVEMPPVMGYDDVSVFLDACGGLYLSFGVQDTAITPDGQNVAPVAGGRGLAPNHHPAFYADDASLVDSLRVHTHVALDHLAGELDIPREPTAPV